MGVGRLKSAGDLTNCVFFFFLAGKDKKACTSLPRLDQDTCLFPVEEKAVEYYFASDARSAKVYTSLDTFQLC